mgnify:CR=1 FL=1
MKTKPLQLLESACQKKNGRDRKSHQSKVSRISEGLRPLKSVVDMSGLSRSRAVWRHASFLYKNDFFVNRVVKLLAATNTPNDQAHPTAAKATVGGTENI